MMTLVLQARASASNAARPEITVFSVCIPLDVVFMPSEQKYLPTAEISLHGSHVRILLLSHNYVSLWLLLHIFCKFEIQKHPGMSFERPPLQLSHGYVQRKGLYRIVEKRPSRPISFLENGNFFANCKNDQKTINSRG